jgi:hypothetical protein
MYGSARSHLGFVLSVFPSQDYKQGSLSGDCSPALLIISQLDNFLAIFCGINKTCLKINVADDRE